MDENNQTLETHPGEQLTDAGSAEGTQNVVVEQTTLLTTPTLSLDEINSLTGHRYANVDEARKGLDNLKRAVGQKEIVREVTPADLVQKVASLEAQVAEANFYTEHPELKAHKDILSKFGNPYEAIKDPVIQKVVEAVKAREESEDFKLKSNSRIAAPQSSDYQQDFEKAQNSGNWAEFLAKHKQVGYKTN
jgi:hypothetical protein